MMAATQDVAVDGWYGFHLISKMKQMLICFKCHSRNPEQDVTVDGFYAMDDIWSKIMDVDWTKCLSFA